MLAMATGYQAVSGPLSQHHLASARPGGHTIEVTLTFAITILESVEDSYVSTDVLTSTFSNKVSASTVQN